MLFRAKTLWEKCCNNSRIERGRYESVPTLLLPNIRYTYDYNGYRLCLVTSFARWKTFKLFVMAFPVTILRKFYILSYLSKVSVRWYLIRALGTVVTLGHLLNNVKRIIYLDEEGPVLVTPSDWPTEWHHIFCKI